MNIRQSALLCALWALTMTGCDNDDSPTAASDAASSTSLAESSSSLASSSSIYGTSSATFSSSSEGGFSSTDASSSSSAGTSSATLSSSAMASSSTSTLDGRSCIYTPGTGTPAYGTLTCAEKNYKTVTIGNAVWMAENLNYGVQVLGSVAQSQDGVVEKYCYDDAVANCTTDGGLYQWAEAMQLPTTCNSTSCAGQISSGNHQGICPTGWHVPKAGDWTALITALGATEETVGKRMKFNNTGFPDWDASTYNDGNTSGFSAWPVGYRLYDGNSNERGYFTDFWEASEFSEIRAYSRNLSIFAGYLDVINGSKAYGMSLRCVMD